MLVNRRLRNGCWCSGAFRVVFVAQVFGVAGGVMGGAAGCTADIGGARDRDSVNTPAPTTATTTASPGAGGGPGVGGGTGTGGGEGGPEMPGTTVIRRLNRAEYNNALGDLLGDTTSPAKQFPPEEQGLGFNNNAAALTISPVLVQAQLAAAEAVATTAVSQLSTLLPCSTLGDDACAQEFITTFGERAFRRPVEMADRVRLTAIFNQGKSVGGFSAGIEWVIQTVLLSPRFLYRVELSSAKLDSWEVAARLSFLLWQTLPDPPLLEAARSDALVEPGAVSQQAQRLLADPRSRLALGDFSAQWLKYSSVPAIHRDPQVFPDFNPALAESMRQELHAFTGYALLDASSSLQTLLTSSESFLDGRMAAFYGAPAPTDGTFNRVTLEPTQRSGILTRAGLLAALSHPDQTSPVERGKFIREQFFCESVPPPPPSVVNTLPPVSPSFTARDRMTQHVADPSCGACHQLMDPMGFGLENFDAVGQWRANEGGKAVDASGSIVATDSAGAFNGPFELSNRLATSAQVNTCAATQLFRFAFGREERGGDVNSIHSLAKVLKEGGNFNQVLLTLSESAAFRNR